MYLGQNVVYRVHEEHKAETVVGTEMVDGVEQPKVLREGSIHHREMEEFAGLVGRVHDDGSCDLVIFPPNKPPVWIDRVTAGDADHQFREPDGKKRGKKEAAGAAE